MIKIIVNVRSSWRQLASLYLVNTGMYLQHLLLNVLESSTAFLDIALGFYQLFHRILFYVRLIKRFVVTLKSPRPCHSRYRRKHYINITKVRVLYLELGNSLDPRI